MSMKTQTAIEIVDARWNAAQLLIALKRRDYARAEALAIEVSEGLNRVVYEVPAEDATNCAEPVTA